jgi:hypothetical protein
MNFTDFLIIESGGMLDREIEISYAHADEFARKMNSEWDKASRIWTLHDKNQEHIATYLPRTKILKSDIDAYKVKQMVGLVEK